MSTGIFFLVEAIAYMLLLIIVCLIKPLSKELLLEKINKNILNRVDILENNKEISK